MVFGPLDGPADLVKKQKESLGIHCRLDCSLPSRVSRNFSIRIYPWQKARQDNRQQWFKRHACLRTNITSCLPNGNPTLGRWEQELQLAEEWLENRRETNQMHWMAHWPTERSELPIFTACTSHTKDPATAAYSALVKSYHRQTKLLFLITKPTQNQRLLTTTTKEIPSLLQTLAAVTDNHYMMTGALCEMSLAGLRQGLQRY